MRTFLPDLGICFDPTVTSSPTRTTSDVTVYLTHRQLLFAADRGLTVITHNRRDFVLLHDAWLTWAHEWQANRRHSGIFILDHVLPADMLVAAQAIDDHVRDSMTSLDNTFHNWTRASGWEKSTN